MNKSSIIQDLETLIEMSKSGQPIPTEVLQRISTMASYQFMDAIIRDGVSTNPENYKSPNTYLLNQIRVRALECGKALTSDQEIELVIKIRQHEITSLSEELSSDKYADITPEKDNSQPNRNSSDMGGR